MDFIRDGVWRPFIVVFGADAGIFFLHVCWDTSENWLKMVLIGGMVSFYGSNGMY